MPNARALADPLKVGTAKQLFIDGRFLRKARGVTLTVNRPRPTREKLIIGAKPWEDSGIGAYVSVIQEGSRIHLWYEPMDKGGAFRLAYAFSDDGGATFKKPALGVFDYKGSKDNNLLMAGVQGATVFRNRPGAPAAEKYCLYHTGTDQVRANVAFVSPDGIRWTPAGPVPFLDHKIDPRLTLDAQNVIFWDSRLRKYVCYPRCNVATKGLDIVRKFGRAESKTFGDFGHFAMVLEPDAKDPAGFDWYETAAIQYPYAADSYFMFPAAFHHTPPTQAHVGPIDLRFAVSRDGISWARPDRRPLISRGHEGDWDSGMLYPGLGLSRHKDELSLYYTAYDYLHGTGKRGALGGVVTRAIYRLDGFVSADAEYEGGEFTTPALVFDGDRLEVNFDGSAGGWVRVEIRDAAGKPVPGFTEKNADKVTGNATAKTVTWGGKADLSALKGTPIRVRFVMADAKLYAFQFVRPDGSAK